MSSDDERLLEKAEEAMAELSRLGRLDDHHFEVLAALRIRLHGGPVETLDDLIQAAGDLPAKSLDDLVPPKPKNSLDDLEAPKPKGSLDDLLSRPGEQKKWPEEPRG